MGAAMQEFFSARDLESWEADSPTPLYHQLYSLLKSRILDGSIRRGSQMPTEQQLAKQFNVSRITAKRAMDELAADGLVERRRGRGTHVVYHYQPTPVHAPRIGRLEKLAATGEGTQLNVLEVSEEIPPVDVREELNLAPGQKAHRLVRVQRNEAGEPYAYYLSWTVGIKGGYSQRELETGIRQEIFVNNGLKVTTTEQYLGADSASVEVARVLEMNAGDPILTLLCHSYTEDGALVDILYGQYNPKRFQYHLTLGIEHPSA